MLIKVFLDKLLYSPFDFPEFKDKFIKENIRVVTNPSIAHVIMSSYLKVLNKYTINFGKIKKYLLWTHEPYHDITLTKSIKLKNGAVINIMNVYTGDVFTHNFRYFYFSHPIDLLSIDLIPDPTKKVIDNTKKYLVALSTYYPQDYYKNNPHTLLPKRYELIEYGFQHNLLDVHGKDWDKHSFVRSLGNTRNQSDRRQSKQEILEDYKFNICIENVDYPYYVTEKIWEPIKYGCLPIYYANSTIYQVFPENSFIDYRNFINPKDLYDYVLNMTEEEYVVRFNRCVDSFNSVVTNSKNNTYRFKSDNLNINYLEYNSCYKHLLDRIKSISK
jgi:hypothetical protein